MWWSCYGCLEFFEISHPTDKSRWGGWSTAVLLVVNLCMWSRGVEVEGIDGGSELSISCIGWILLFLDQLLPFQDNIDLQVDHLFTMLFLIFWITLDLACVWTSFCFSWRRSLMDMIDVLRGVTSKDKGIVVLGILFWLVLSLVFMFCECSHAIWMSHLFVQIRE